ncbi:HTH-type transcriptional regulator Hpr [Salsuginibacillus kocurii]|uniref:HTH-type transcriptional regulator Hpr n=1 Tax=Salsuginibacillus kocurii TaxID=427078 RepID=UPI00037ED41B|nr:HTH-type transcriptional regulator Hpr [Salsuginibacillus kocurii]
MDYKPPHSVKESMVFSHKLAQLSKALWKSVEKDWQQWIQPFNLNINEHHILWIAYYMDGVSISDVAKFGVMHVSTAFNFSKKLEARELLVFSKRDSDKRNTYIFLTEQGKQLFLETLEHYQPDTYNIYTGALPIKELYGRFPEFSELMTIVRYVYGEDFMEIFDGSLEAMEEHFTDNEGKVQSISTENSKNDPS